MAEATVTIKLTPDEHRTILFALEEARRTTFATVEAAAPGDMRGLRTMVIKLDDLKAKL